MASKHLEKPNKKQPKEPKVSAAPKHQKKAPAKKKKQAGEEPVSQPEKKAARPEQEMPPEAPAKTEAAPEQTPDVEATQRYEKVKITPAEKVSKKATKAEAAPKKAQKTEKPGQDKTPKTKKSTKEAASKTGKPAKAKTAKEEPAPEMEPMNFRQERTAEEKEARRLMAKKDVRRAAIALVIMLLLLAAVVGIWLYRDRFQSDDLIISASSAAVAQEEYLFDAGSGQVFAAAGKGLALATSSGLELMDEDGNIVTSKLFQMETPAIAACDDFAVFYDLGGTNIAVASFDGTVKELSVEGEIFSVTVSSGGYIAVTTACTGYRALVAVYAPTLDQVYQWYSSSAWVISAAVSPDNRKMAVLSYTASGSEVRFFSLSQTEQLATFSVSDTVLLDVHWFTSSQLCAYSTSQALFIDSSGQWLDTYSFADQYLVGCTFGGEGFVTFSLSPYRVGTTSTLVSLDAGGRVLGTTEVQSEIVSLTASGTEVLVLSADGATLYNSSLSNKGQLTGLPGFKYGLLRNRGEALLIASNYAEVYTF
jgi:hypothetical protein